MFFIGPSGYIITLILTAFLPVIMLVVSPMQSLRPGWPSESEWRSSHSCEEKVDRLSFGKAYSIDLAIDMMLDSEAGWMPPVTQFTGIIVIPKVSSCTSPVLTGNGNKAPPSV